MYMSVEKKQGLGLARLGLYTRVRVTDLALGLELWLGLGLHTK